MGELRRLSELERRRYFHDGIVFPVRVLDDDETRHFRAACDQLETRLGGRPRTVEVRQMHLHFPWAYQLATHPRVLDAVEDLLGPDLLVWATELFAKHPGDEAVSIAWHQDRPYMGFEGGETVSAWIALADSVPANGCMRAVPGPGRHSPPRTIAADGANSSGRKRHGGVLQVDEQEAVDVVLRAGEMSLHDSDIVHGSGFNRSNQKRVGFVVRYVTPQARPLEGRPPVVLARGRDTAGHFRLAGRPSPSDTEEALAGMRASATEHLEAMLHNLKSAKH